MVPDKSLPVRPSSPSVLPPVSTETPLGQKRQGAPLPRTEKLPTYCKILRAPSMPPKDETGQQNTRGTSPTSSSQTSPTTVAKVP